MFAFVLFLIYCNGFCASHATEKPDMDMGTYITMHKYPYENHTVLTDDGYILTMGRIPVNLNKTCDKVKGAVMIYHGMVNNGIIFFYLGPDQSIGFQLSDKCYDVWIPNTRGTRYSSRHVNLTIHDRAFWNFSYDELAKYDLKANIDYVLNTTGESKIHYLGFSQGATQILMLLSRFPEYNTHMTSLQLVAPIAYFDNFTAFPEWLPKKFLYTLTKAAPEIVSRAVPDNDYLLHNILTKICDSDDGLKLCSLILNAIDAKPSEDEAFQNQKWSYNFPEPISLKTMAHYAQFYMSSTFQMYDYGPDENFQRYGTKTPPHYYLENITSPVHLYHAEGDTYSTKQNVDRLAKQIVNLRQQHYIDDPNWGHRDFVANRNHTRFQKYLLESFNQYN